MQKFEAQGTTIFVKAQRTFRDDGTFSVRMGFPVLTMSGYLNDPEGAAEELSDLLSEHWSDHE